MSTVGRMTELEQINFKNARTLIDLVVRYACKNNKGIEY
jgi:hypothetical protein